MALLTYPEGKNKGKKMKKMILLFTLVLSMVLLAKEPFYKGEVTQVLHGGGYTYLNIKERTKETFWIVVSRIDKVKTGDYIRFQKEFVTKNFKSKALNKIFKEIMFASNLSYKKHKKKD